MAQHSSLSKAYRNLDLKTITRLSASEARDWFTILRWGSTEIMPCPRCKTTDQHYHRRHRHQWQCKHCDMTFSVTTGTPFSNRKISFQDLMLLIYLFVSQAKDVPASSVLAKVGITYRTAFTNFGKIREALFIMQDTTPLTGLVHIDGLHICGKPRRPRNRQKSTSQNINEKMRNRKLGMANQMKGKHTEPWNKDKFKNRRVVLVMRQLSEEQGVKPTRSIVQIVKAEDINNVYPVVKKYVAEGSEVHTDEGGAYSWMTKFYTHKTVNHSRQYATDDGISNNQAESYFGLLRRQEYGVFHGARPQYLAFYANAVCWRQDNKKSCKEMFELLLKTILQCGHSKAFRGYTQGRKLGFEYVLCQNHECFHTSPWICTCPKV